MNVEKIVVDVFKSGIDLYVDKGMLAYEVKKGGLPDDVREVLKENKQEIIHYLLNNRVDTNTKQKLESREVPGAVLLNNNMSDKIRPLFLAHEDSGEVFYYSYLAKALEDHFPVYGLQAFGTGMSLENFSMRELASNHIKAMKEIQPEGPYRIAGWSAGGGIAYEIAYQLLAADETIEFLGLLDYFYSLDTKGVTFSIDYIDTILQTAMEYFNTDFNLLLLKEYIHDIYLVPLFSDQQIEEVKSTPSLRGLAKSLNRSGWELDSFFEQINLYHALILLSAGYRPPAIPIDVSLFYVTEKEDDEPDIDDSVEYMLEQSDQNIWKELLGSHINFIPIGGNHESMIRKPHVDSLADSIIEEISRLTSNHVKNTVFSPIVHIQKGAKTCLPLICVPGSAMTPVSFLDLVQVLASDVPVAAIQYRGLDGLTVPFMSVEVAAKYYIKAIKAEYPDGPYRLLGHSFGGWVAYEMAVQLMRQGDQVDLLVVIDSRQPGSNNQHVKMSRTDHLIDLVNVFSQNHDAGIVLDRETIIELNEVEQLKLLVDLLPIDVDIQSMRSIVNAFIINSETTYTQDFKFYNKAFLINAAEEKGDDLSIAEKTNAWKNHLPNMEIVNLPGNHMSLLKKPLVSEIGSLISGLLK